MPTCRFCHVSLSDIVVDLGASPLANSYLTQTRLAAMEPCYPLKVWFCRECGLVQLEAFASPQEIFSDYDYFSSYSDSWLEHAKAYTHHMIKNFGIGTKSQVIEIASNDGYLLQYFIEQGVNALGIEPAENVADVARSKGVPTQSLFFGRETARRLKEQGHAADLALGNNVLAHVPDINDFVEGFRIILKPNGLVTVEFPHLLNLIQLTQFDTIYHEHFSYLSLHTVQRVFKEHGLTVFDVEELPTHGGSLRVYAALVESSRIVTPRVLDVLSREREAQLHTPQGYTGFSNRVENIKNGLLQFLLNAKAEGKTVMAYGAAAKGNTLLNYAGIRPDLISAVADRNPNKQTKFLPGSRIPIVAPEELLARKPDYILILPWNLRAEVIHQMDASRSWGGHFVTAIPELQVMA